MNYWKVDNFFNHMKDNNLEFLCTFYNSKCIVCIIHQFLGSLYLCMFERRNCYLYQYLQNSSICKRDNKPLIHYILRKGNCIYCITCLSCSIHQGIKRHTCYYRDSFHYCMTNRNYHYFNMYSMLIDYIFRNFYLMK